MIIKKAILKTWTIVVCICCENKCVKNDLEVAEFAFELRMFFFVCVCV